jgi:PPOX class probable F420-dependent enzyme
LEGCAVNLRHADWPAPDTGAMIESAADSYLAAARVARLATADSGGRPQVVPICFALTAAGIVTPIDEKPKDVDPMGLRRVRDVRENPSVSLVADHYAEDWSQLGWVQVRGTAELLDPDEEGHEEGVTALRGKYDQYADHELSRRPIIQIEPESVRSWGQLEPESDG